MTDDSHVLIREDGTCEDLPSLQGFYCYSGPEDEGAARRKSAVENLAIAQMLVDKGLHEVHPEHVPRREPRGRGGVTLDLSEAQKRPLESAASGVRNRA
jgi:hypothetical protein